MQHFLRVFLVISVCLLFSITSTNATEIFVDINHGQDSSECVKAEPCRTLQRGWSVAADGDTIILAHGEYIIDETLRMNDLKLRHLTVRAAKNAAFVSILAADPLDSFLFYMPPDPDGPDRTQLVSGSKYYSLVLINLEIRDFQRVVFAENCQARVEIQGCRLFASDEPSIVPAIDMNDITTGSSLQVTDSSFIGFKNSAVHVDQRELDEKPAEVEPSISFVRCRFESNQAQYQGGALSLWLYGNDLEIVNSSFVGNTARATGLSHDGGGGAVLLWQRGKLPYQILVSGSTFIGNSAGPNSASRPEQRDHGGSMVLNSINEGAANLTIERSVFTSNSAYSGSNGGAIRIFHGWAKDIDVINIVDSSFDSNYAHNDCGALSLELEQTAARVRIQRNNFTGNSAMHSRAERGAGGGALGIQSKFDYLKASTGIELDVSQNHFEANLVTLNPHFDFDNAGVGMGGALRVRVAGSLLSIIGISNNTFFGNQAWKSGGAVSVLASSSYSNKSPSLTTIISNIFINNVANSSGGAVSFVDIDYPQESPFAKGSLLDSNVFDSNTVLSGSCASVNIVGGKSIMPIGSNNTFRDNYAADPCKYFPELTCFGTAATQLGVCGGYGMCLDFNLCNCTKGHQPDCAQVVCPPGSFYDRRQRACLPCPQGTASNVLDVERCPACNGGSFANSTGMLSCTLCGQGTYSTAIGAVCSDSCVKCPAGTASSVLGGSSPAVCQSCPLGSAASREGMAKCDLCPKGTFSNEKGLPSCVTCPGNSYTLEIGATSKDDCITCLIGSDVNETRDGCHINSLGITLLIVAMVGAVLCVAGLGVFLLVRGLRARALKRVEEDLVSKRMLQVASYSQLPEDE